MFFEWKRAVTSNYMMSFVTYHVGRTYLLKRDGFEQHVISVTSILDKIVRQSSWPPAL